MSTRQYIGARYVPTFYNGAHGVEWDGSTVPYEALTIVTYLGNSYTSKKNVPIGVEITNTDYWVMTSNNNAQIGELAIELNELTKTVEEAIYYITPEDFGAIGDGETDDTSAIQRAINAAQTDRYILKFSCNKWYGISSPIEITSPVYIDGNNARIFPLTEMNSVINVNIPNPLEQYGRGLICNLMINCAYKSNSAITNTSNINGVRFSNIQINDALVCAIDCANSLIIDEVFIRNTNPTHTDVIGIRLNGTDNYVSNYTAINCQKNLVINGLSYINTCCSWNSFSALMTTSIFAEVNATAEFTNCMIDTWAKCFTGNTSPFLTNCFFFWSSAYYTDESVGDTTTLPILFSKVPYIVNCKVSKPNGRTNKRSNFSETILSSDYNVLANNVLEAVYNLPSCKGFDIGLTVNTSNITATVNKHIKIPSMFAEKIVIHIECTTEYAFTSSTPIFTISGSDNPDEIVTGRAVDITTNKVYPVIYQSNNNRFVIGVSSGEEIGNGDSLVIDVEYYQNYS